MINISSDIPTIRIDVKNSRIHIHNRSLKKIASPSFVCLGYNPKTKVLLILAARSGEQGALRLHFDNHGSCYIHSKRMIEGIRVVSGLLTEDKSYLLTGKVLTEIPAIVFPIKSYIITEGTE